MSYEILVISKSIIIKQSEDFFYFNNIINIRSSFDYELPISNSVIRLVFYDVTTNITIPNSLLIKNVISVQEVKEIIENEMHSVIINLDKEKKSYVEIQRCKHCGYIKKVEVKI